MKAIETYLQENNITAPDFTQWATYIHSASDVDPIRMSLEEAYSKGISLGYQVGVATREEWWEQQDKEAVLQEITDLGQLQDEATGSEVAIPIKHTGDKR